MSNTQLHTLFFNKLTAYQNALFSNRYVNAVIAATMAIVPLSIIRGLIITLSVIFSMTGHLAISKELDQLQKAFVMIAPLLINAYVALHWSLRNRLSQVHTLTISIGTMLVISRFLMDNPDTYPSLSIPFALLSAIFSCRIYELICNHLNGKTKWIESRYRFLISLSIYIIMVLLFGCLVGLISKLLWKYVDVFLHSFSDDIYPRDYIHGLFYLLMRVLPWGLGIHGYFVFQDVEQLLKAETLQNLAAWHAGQAQLNILSTSFYDVWCNAGGTGNTLCLVITIFLSRSSPRRNLLGVSLPLALFNINEPLIFGIPIVLNPMMIIPFAIVPAMGYSIAYFATMMEWIPHISTFVNWATPPLINTWLATNGSIPALACHIVILALGVAIYYPFLSASGANAQQDLNSSLTLYGHQSHPVDQEMVPNHHNLSEESDWREAKYNIEKLQARGSFILYFQPQVSVADGKIIAAETLIRHMGHDGRLTPPVFLKYYERLGLMSEIDFWVLENTVEYIHRSLAGFENLTISVNISPQTLVDSRLFTVLNRVLNKPLPKGCALEFEITESQKVTDPVKVAEVLAELSHRGIRLALDDFGSGYSTLNYLTSYPLNKIKLDRSMVLGLAKENGFSFLYHVVKLCEITHCDLLIEGVETEEELALVQQAGITLCQGFFFHRPMPGDQLCMHLSSQQA